MIDQSPKPILATNPRRMVIRCGNVVIAPGQTVPVDLEFVNMYAHVGLNFDYSGMQENMIARHESGRLALDFWAPLSMVDGYGRHALSIYQGIRSLGVDVRLRNRGYFVDRTWLPPEIEHAAYSSKANLPTKAGVAMSVPYDPMLTEHSSIFKIGITQFETNRFPKTHVQHINLLDHLIVTSNFQVKMMRRSGVKVPISVMHSGIDTEFWQPIQRPKDGKFKCLILGALSERKNPLGAVRIFQAASENNPDWSLTIKTRGAIDDPALQSLIEVVKLDNRIRLVVNETGPTETRQIYYDHDCFLWPSKGEGCGLPPLEAMATGMELVCSDNSGMSDYVDEKWCYPIRTATMEAAGFPKNTKAGVFTQQYVNVYGDVGEWWVPDENHAVRQLWKCFQNWYDGRGKGARAAEYVHANRTLELQAKSVVKVVELFV